MTYNWQLPHWPQFTYTLKSCEKTLSAFVEQVGRTGGLLEGLSENIQMETAISMMVSEAIKTSEIEGEYLSRRDVLSSIRHNLGLFTSKKSPKDKRAEGVASLMIAVRKYFAEPLSENMLFHWHAILMQGAKKIKTGAWRTHAEPMQVISGPMGKEKVHFEAPPSRRVPREMKAFIKWFNDTAPGQKKEISSAPVRAALVHLYFESIHPFEDGNGRIGRALSEKVLSQNIGRPVLLSLSASIQTKRNLYYESLKAAQRSNEVTAWIEYFAGVCLKAQLQAEEQVRFTLKKTQFFDRFSAIVNERQIKVLRRMLDEGPGGFRGGMNARKYMLITKTSKATATRDLQELVRKTALKSEGGGRSIRYQVNIPN